MSESRPELQEQAKFPFEFHVTVDASEIDVNHYRAICRSIGVKAIVLDLEANDTDIRDVMTSSKLYGTDDEAFAELARIAEDLESADLAVVRRKIETAPWHPEAPTEKNGIVMPLGSYFESHFGINILPSEKDHLKQLIDESDLPNSLHLSRNAFKQDDDRITVMATARSYEGVAEDFIANVADHHRLLSSYFDVDDPIVEFALFDSNTQHDDEWIAA